MENIKEFRSFNLNENLNDLDIDGSGLFHWNTSIKRDKKLKMLKWYNNLSPEEKKYVRDFRHEAAMDEYDSHCGEDL